MLAIVAACLWGALIWAVAPAIHYDALVYHLSVPSIYVQNHGLVEVTEQFRSYWAHNGEMLYTLSLLLVGQPMPALVHLTFGLLVLALVALLGWRLGGSRAALFAALLFYTLPIVTWESGAAYVDLMVTLYVFAALYAGLMWWLRQDDEWLVIAGLMGGLGLGVKVSAVVMLLPLSLFLAGVMVRRYGASRRSLAGVLRLGVPLLALSAPWMLRDWLWTGNPVFPFLNRFFRSELWGDMTVDPGRYGQGRGVLTLLRLPLDLVTGVRNFDTQLPGGAAGAVPLLALPWLSLRSRSQRCATLILSLLAGTAILVWFVLVPNSRYLLPVFPALAVLGGLNLEMLWLLCSGRGSRRLVVVGGLVVLLCYATATRLAHVVTNWQTQDRYPCRLALGLESPEQFLSRALVSYDALKFLDKQAEGRARVLAIGSDQFGFYTSSSIEPLSGSWKLLTLVAAQPSAASLATTLETLGFQFVLVDWNVIRALPESYSGQLVADDAFLEGFARLEFARHNVYVYRLLPEGTGAREAYDLLANGGFEELGEQGVPAAWVARGSTLVDSSAVRAHGGNVALQISGQARLSQLVPVEPGELYTLSYWARADRPGQFACLHVFWLNSAQSSLGVSIDVVPVSGAWRVYKLSTTAPPGSASANVLLGVQADSSVWFDDAAFARMQR